MAIIILKSLGEGDIMNKSVCYGIEPIWIIHQTCSICCCYWSIQVLNFVAPSLLTKTGSSKDDEVGKNGSSSPIATMEGLLSGSNGLMNSDGFSVDGGEAGGETGGGSTIAGFDGCFLKNPKIDL